MRLFGKGNIFARAREAHEEKKRKDQAVIEFGKRVCAIPVEVARMLALHRIATSKVFTLTSRTADEALPGQLHETLRTLFTTYRTVEWKGMAWVSLDDWAECPELPGYFVIGEDTETALACDSRTGTVGFYEEEGKVSLDYPSVFHWILELGTDSTGIEEYVGPAPPSDADAS